MAEAGATTRLVAARLLLRVLQHGDSLARLLPAGLEPLPPRERPLAQAMLYGALRRYHRYHPLLRSYLTRPLKDRDRILEALLLLGFEQLTALSIPPHAAVHATVAAARGSGRPWATGLLNAVLRRFQRHGAKDLEALARRDETVRWNHPRWLLESLREAWPECWQAILAGNDAAPPMVLRVNRRRTTPAACRARLATAGIEARPVAGFPDALWLPEPVPVEQLPGFEEGDCSVQDTAAQLAARLLDPQPGERILDACAAPGGKTAHLLEHQPALARLVALDRDPTRAREIGRTLERLGLQAQVQVADAAEPESWWDGAPFDRILLDAPCTATGVIRRHPDIKVLRRKADVERLARQQQRLLDALWPLLRPGGTLLYCTCSVLPHENEQQMAAFLAAHPDAVARPPTHPGGLTAAAGLQMLPIVNPDREPAPDGFYHARIGKEPRP